MASYFTLHLDTTAPSVEIYAPTYTVRGIDNEIEVVANEELSLYQEIYIVDSLGVRHDLIFSHETDRFTGIVNFDSYPVGYAQIYAVVKDIVDNRSHIVYEVINIISDIDAMRMTVSVEDVAREIIVSNLTPSVVVRSEVREVAASNNNEYQILVSVSDIAT